MPPLYLKVLGRGDRTLVFSPGVGGTTRYWERRVAPLADTHRLVLVDLLGFGRSPKPWGPYTVERHVAVLAGALAPFGPFTLVGHSFGAIAAVAYAARHVGAVHALVRTGLPYFGSERRAIEYFRRGPAPHRWVMTNVALAAATCIVTRRVLGRALPRLLPDLPREVAEDLVQHTWRSSTSTLWEGVYRYDLAADADRIPADVPVLLLHGCKDATAPLQGVLGLRAAHPRWTLRTIPDGDHHPMLHFPALCLNQIRSFDTPDAHRGSVRWGGG